MYEKLKLEIAEIENGNSPVDPKDLVNTIANLLCDGELATGQYLELIEMLNNMSNK